MSVVTLRDRASPVAQGGGICKALPPSAEAPVRLPCRGPGWAPHCLLRDGGGDRLLREEIRATPQPSSPAESMLSVRPPALGLSSNRGVTGCSSVSPPHGCLGLSSSRGRAGVLFCVSGPLCGCQCLLSCHIFLLMPACAFTAPSPGCAGSQLVWPGCRWGAGGALLPRALLGALLPPDPSSLPWHAGLRSCSLCQVHPAFLFPAPGAVF